MTYCSKCNSETNSTYLVRQLGILCGKCTKEHGEKEIEELTKQRISINNEIHIKNKEIKKAIQADCKHENAINTYYGSCKDNIFTFIYRCPDCNLFFNKVIK